MTKKEPGRIPQTTLGADVLGLSRRPSRWAVRLAWTSALALLAALALLLVSFMPPRHGALRDRPEVHLDERAEAAIKPGVQ